MLRIGDTIFSLDIIEKKFSCDLQHCRGVCCRYGDSGAPLTGDEVEILEEIWHDLNPFLRRDGIAAIEEQGTSITDSDNDKVTPLIDKMDCAYSVFNGEILMCGIEKAWSEGKINFRKPLSCHLFPLRVKQFSDFTAVNYQELSVCSGGRRAGLRDGIYLYEFLKEPLIRAFGEQMYNELCIAAEQFRTNSV
jgi:hypothetical protein